MTAGNQPRPSFPSLHQSFQAREDPLHARQMAARLCASWGAVAELMALCHSHVRRLLPSRLTPKAQKLQRLRHFLSLMFLGGLTLPLPPTPVRITLSNENTWVMSRICQSGMLQLPLTVFLTWEAISRCSRHSTIIMFIWKHFQCVSENTFSVRVSPLPTISTLLVCLVGPLCSLSSQMDMTCFDCKWNLSLHTGRHGQRNWQCWAHQRQ